MLEKTLLVAALYILSYSSIAHADLTQFKLSGNNLKTDEVKKVVSITGKAEVVQGANQLSADKITVDRGNDTLTAEGHCTYTKNGLISKGQRMRFDVSSAEWVQLEVSAH